MKLQTILLLSVVLAMLFGVMAPIEAETVQPAWTAKYGGAEKVVDLVVDAAGNVYVTGTQKYDYLTVKYNSSGVRQWAKRYNFSGGEDTPSAMAIDGAGNLYVTGSSSGGATIYDYATLKYGSSGTLQWVARYNNPESNSDFARDIALDASGNVYVTGGSNYDATDYDIVTIKYDSAGVMQWGVRSIGPGILPGFRDDFGQFIVLDEVGNICVAGTSDLSYTDIVTVKYDASGQQLWSARYDGPAHGNDYPRALAVDDSGNFYVAGDSPGTDGFEDIVLIKYDSAGAQQWVRRYSSSKFYPATAADLALDSAGNVYVTGSTNLKGYNGFLTMKYTPTGKRKWFRIYGAALYASGGASAMDIDDAGSVYVTGGIQSETASYEYATLKYDTNGKQEWVIRYSGPKDFDIGETIALDGSNNVIVSGDSYGSNGWTTIKYLQAADPPAESAGSHDATSPPEEAGY